VRWESQGRKKKEEEKEEGKRKKEDGHGTGGAGDCAARVLAEPQAFHVPRREAAPHGRARDGDVGI
jgi:hypothetical protein